IEKTAHLAWKESEVCFLKQDRNTGDDGKTVAVRGRVNFVSLAALRRYCSWRQSGGATAVC
ncbi:MAG TPA: hypothetical protein VH207_00025, partial [Chthoniobacterales bacterium]|nr:hypothetical protein [Chthoniobacterales bacterium]